MDEAIASDIVATLKKMATQISPHVGFQTKYGGEVMVPDPALPKQIVGGVFIYKDHVSVEFSNGADFTDASGVLEGGGKRRRHLKLSNAGDIAAKDVDGFLRQALA